MTFFLPISRWPGMNGLELGAAAHERFPHIYLIFLTSFTHYAVDSYIVDAYQYILKQQMGERIPPVMRKIILEIQRERKKFRIIEAVNDTQKIFYQDIIYIKKVKGSKYVEYMTLHGNYRERIPIDQLMKELNSMEFIFVERSFIVNIEHIIRLKGNIVYMENGDEITISRGGWAMLKWRSANIGGICDDWHSIPDYSDYPVHGGSLAVLPAAVQYIYWWEMFK